jgi:hypothetical protein
MLSPRCLAIALFAVAPAVVADSLQSPFATANRQPLVQVYGLPDTESASLQTAGDSQLGLSLDIANSFSSNSGRNRAIFLDGESYRANLQWRYGWSEQFEMGLDIPYWLHDGGFMDSSIENFHELFDMDNGNREDYRRDQIWYRYTDTRSNTILYNLTERSEGLGDVRISGAYQLAKTGRQHWALRSSLKLPTGDADKLTGSEGLDLALSLHFSDSQWLANPQLAFHANAGLLWMDDSKVVASEHENLVLFGSTSLSWRWRDTVVWKLQLDGHTAFYDSELRELGEPAFQLLIGGSFRATKSLLVDVSLSEDILVNRSPDVVLQLALRQSF